MYSYQNQKLNCTRAMYIDIKEIILVCGFRSNNLHLIDNSGKLTIVLLTESEGLNQPYTVSFRPSNSTLAVAGSCQTFVELG